MLAISIALVLVMLAARSSVIHRIDEVKQATASTITVSAAGIRGGQGGGDPLTTDTIATIKNTSHVQTVVSTLTDQLGTDDTNLTPSTTLGRFGERAQRFEESGSASESMPMPSDETESSSTSNSNEVRRPPQARTTVTGTTDPNSMATNGGTLKLTSGTTIDGTGSDAVALVGSNLAKKNNLAVGSTFTAYGATVTVKGIFETGNNFADNGIIMPLATVQKLTNQPGSVINATVTVDSSEQVPATVTALTAALGDKADVTSAADRASASLEPLKNISNLTLVGVFGAAGAGAIIMLLAMVMIVRERRREIGVMKAIGGTNGKVIVQFITEAITLTCIGAVVGIVLGVLASGPLTKALVTSSESTASSSIRRGGPGGGMGGPGGAFREAQTNVQSITGEVSPSVFAGAIAITFLIAILGSALPAWLIARIRPAEVLRTE